MKKLVIVGFLGLVGCGSNQVAMTTPVNTVQQFLGCSVATPGATVTLHSFGDSFTVGSGAGSNWPAVTDNCLGYQTLLTQALGVNGDNQGIGGTLMVDTHYNLMMAATENAQDINTILSGFNDITLFGGDQTHLNQFVFELTASITHLRSISSAVYVGTPTRVPLASQTSMYLHTDANVTLYSDAIKQVVQSFNDPKIVLVDTNAAYNPDTMVSADGYHPSTYGHQVIEQTFLNAIQN